jgi:glycosyltransferase involved in cell wall biosynthesis
MKRTNRIAIVTSAQHAIPHGGIGQFTKSITELLISYGHEIHILFDKKPTNNFLFSVGDRHFYSIKPIPSEKAPDRHKQGIDHAKIQNFVNVLNSTIDFDYDIYLVNTSEAFDAINQVNPNSKVILYTHLFNQIYPEQSGKSVFTPEFVNHFNSFLYGNHTVATQSEYNRQRLINQGVKNCLVLPMPIPETNLLDSSQHIEKSGVLYIGTHSPGKNPSAYIKAMAKTKLPCKVMTSAKGKLKFIENFAKAGITDYDIRVGITGREKVEFIKSSKVFFMPSLLENYPFAFLECVGHMPTVVLDNQIWSNNFDSKFYHKTTSRKAHEVIKKLYNQNYNDDALQYVINLDQLAKSMWKDINK